MSRRFLCALAVLLAVAPLAAESTRTLHASLAVDSSTAFAVDNLAGTMSVVPGPGSEVTAVATVHAENEELASRVRFDEVRGKDGRRTLRVIYNDAAQHVVRYPAAHGTSRVHYDGRRVEVSSNRGDVLWAEVVVQVPATKVDGVFRNMVGTLRAERLQGRLTLDTASGDIEVSRLMGEVKADTGSGDVDAEQLSGSFDCDTGSGDCTITGFDGDTLTLDTGSGDVKGHNLRADRVSADTGSGDVVLRDADVESFEGDTGSGGILLENSGDRLVKMDADTGSGDVKVRLPSDATFELRADTGSGDIGCGFSDAHPIAHGREVVGWERGDRRTKIRADTGSGDVRVEPLR